MTDVDRIEAYVRELETALRRAGRPTQPLVDEATAHLFEDAARIARDEQCDDDEAARRAIARFGAVGDVVAASRKHARVLAAKVARAASIALAAVVAWQTLEDLLAYDGAMGWPFMGEHMLTASYFALVVELAFVGVTLWRSLARGNAPRWLPMVLQLHGAVAAALVLCGFVITLRRMPGFYHYSIYTALCLAPPLWLLVLVQSVAGVRALGQQATPIGPPSVIRPIRD